MNVYEHIQKLKVMADRHVPPVTEVTVQQILRNRPKKTPLVLDALKRAKK